MTRTSSRPRWMRCAFFAEETLADLTAKIL